MTTRPQYVGAFQRKADLEMLGFENKGITSYIDKFFSPKEGDSQEEIKKREEGKQALGKQLQEPLVRNLCHIPINLEIFSSLAYEGKTFSVSQPLNLATVYEKLTDWLIKRYLLERTSTKKQDIEEAGFPKKNPEVKDVLKALEEVAWKTTKSNSLYVNTKRECIDQVFNSNNVRISQVTSVGPFSICDGEGQFIHLTFQEFFSAKYLSRLLKEDEDEAAQIIREKKFDPRWQLTFSMTAGNSFSRRNSPSTVF